MRQEFIAEQLEKIDPSLEFNKFALNAQCTLMHIGLHFHKDVRAFFELPEWNEPGHQAELMEQIKIFMEKYVK